MVCSSLTQQQQCAEMGRSWARSTAEMGRSWARRRTAQIGEQQNWGQKSRLRARRSRFRAKKSRLRAKQITTRTREGAEMELVRRKSRRGCEREGAVAKGQK
ncbi:hypothetical protein Adt_31461 [Abeliophyllum distichum]|uniref:Uncharacterized protein n=1 Tax=Abeliophyllum distichum TaxID=126358 RepID=A0ABD1RE68_9LAMI